MLLCDLPYWGPNLLSKWHYQLEINLHTPFKGMLRGRTEREDICAQFLAGKCMEIVSDIISTWEVILLRNKIRRLFFPQNYILKLDFQGLSLYPCMHLGQDPLSWPCCYTTIFCPLYCLSASTCLEGKSASPGWLLKGIQHHPKQQQPQYCSHFLFAYAHNTFEHLNICGEIFYTV